MSFLACNVLQEALGNQNTRWAGMTCFFLRQGDLQRILLAEKWLLTSERATFSRCASLLSHVTVGTRSLGLGLDAGQQVKCYRR